MLRFVIGLGLAVATAACSSSSSPSGGSAGEPTSSSSPSTSSDDGGSGAGEAGGTCAASTSACQACVQTKCTKEHGACVDDSTCNGAVAGAFSCFCDAQKKNDSAALASCMLDFTCNGNCTPEDDLYTCAKDSCASCGL